MCKSVSEREREIWVLQILDSVIVLHWQEIFLP